MPSLEERAREINQAVKGFLNPIFYRDDPETGRRLHGLGPEDFKKVVEGYACPECLAEFNTYTVRCPVCRYTRDVERDIAQAPQLWVDHLRAREERISPESPLPGGNPEGGFGRLARNSDVEQVPLSKLRKKRPGARRS